MKVLQDIGLTKNQADIYLLLLKLGVVSVSKLAKHTRLHRSNLYDVLENLQKKGLVNSSNEEGVRFYRPSPPQRIKIHVQETYLADNVYATQEYGRNLYTNFAALHNHNT